MGVVGIQPAPAESGLAGGIVFFAPGLLHIQPQLFRKNRGIGGIHRKAEENLRPVIQQEAVFRQFREPGQKTSENGSIPVLFGLGQMPEGAFQNGLRKEV